MIFFCINNKHIKAMAEVALDNAIDNVSLDAASKSDETLELYDHGSMVSETINMGFIIEIDAINLFLALRVYASNF